MSKILLTWQLGGGQGHLQQMRPYIERLAGRGHEIHWAVQDVAAATRLGPLPVYLHQAPFKHDDDVPFARPGCFARVLGNCGFSDDRELFGLAGAWRNLYGLEIKGGK